MKTHVIPDSTRLALKKLREKGIPCIFLEKDAMYCNLVDKRMEKEQGIPAICRAIGITPQEVINNINNHKITMKQS